jgi:hypothetical protein
MTMMRNIGANVKYSYAAEKFSNARRMLMLPPPAKEAQIIALAFHEISLCLRDLRQDDLDDSAKDWLAKVQSFMDTTGVVDLTGSGTYQVKAQSLTQDQKLELAGCVDELASWFKRKHSEH